MKTQLVKLTDKEIQEQKNYVAKYQQLINKEIAMLDLANLENIKIYTSSLEGHLKLVKYPFIEMPVFN